MSPIAVLFIVMIILLVAGLPIGVAIGFATIAGIIVDGTPLVFFTQKLFNTFDSFPMMAVPFFLLAGDIMQHGSLANSLLGMCNKFMGHMRAGLANISIMTSLFYGSLCGSAAATTAAVGGIMIPAMEKDQYPASFAAGLNAAAGGLGVIIPPSIPLIIFGACGSVSITDLFIAGILPGILVGFAYMFTATLISTIKGYGTLHKRASWKERLESVKKAKWAILVPLIVLGFIYGGLTTPTEAGAIAVLYAIVVELFITTVCLHSRFGI